MSQKVILKVELLDLLGMKRSQTPHGDEAVFFKHFFIAGLWFPCHEKLSPILDRFNVFLHQLTPNAIINLSKFIWAVKIFRGEVDVDSFCPFYELHHQTN